MRGAALVIAMLVGGATRCVGAQAPPAATLDVEAVQVHLVMNASEFGPAAARITPWIERSLHIVASYYEGFPVREVTIVVSPGSMSGVGGGTTFGTPRALIRLRVGREVSAATLLEDWVLVHEMTHLALPDVGEEHAWLSEGLATYVEGVARVRAGNRSELDVWAEDLRQMPHGLPQPGDQGLDHTHTWGRTYWGGALFCLLADVQIRQHTGNRLGLEHALRAIARASGGLGTSWPVGRVFATGDAAVGAHVLEELYAAHRDEPRATDLTALWHDLGIEADGDSVRLRADAPLAGIRQAIMRKP